MTSNPPSSQIRESVTPEFITQHLDTWTAAIKTKSSGGRGGGKKEELYGIKKLRELILELAVRGLLVPQDPDDEPASELLRKITDQKNKLIKAKEIKKTKSLPEIKADEVPFILPQGWALARLGDLSLMISKGTTPTSLGYSFQDSGVSFVKIENLDRGRIDKDSITQFISEETNNALSRSKLHAGDLLFSIAGTIGKTAIVFDEDLPANTNQAVAFIRGTESIYSPQYLRIQLDSFVAERTRARARGGAMPNVSLGDLNVLVSPLPPLAEQHRIVAKVDELMTLCDRLEQRQEDSARTHAILVETLLGALTTASGPSAFTEAWQRIAAHFDTLFTTESSIDQLKQTLLQLAVMGKLVEQDPEDESASLLLKDLESLKLQLVRRGVIRKQKALPPLGSKDVPFEIPPNWAWTRLENTIVQVTDGEHLSPKKADTGVKLLTAKHIRSEGVSMEDPQYVSESDAKKFLSRCNPEVGDVFICSRGTIGRSCVNTVTETFCLMGSVILLKKSDAVHPAYLDYFIKSDWGQLFICGVTKGMAVNALYLKDVKLCPTPVPPSPSNTASSPKSMN